MLQLLVIILNLPILNAEYQYSILGPLLFLIYINDLHSCIKFCKTRHFADDTNLLYFDDSFKKLEKF